MSAECSRCGFDIVYPAGTWPVGTCQNCDQQAQIAALGAALSDIAGREWRDEGGRIAAAVARDGLNSAAAAGSAGNTDRGDAA